MINYESIDPKDIRTVFEEYFSVNKNTNEINTCRKVSCAQCLFYGQGSCEIAKKKWLDQLAFDWDKDIDWEKVPVDTPVIVWNSDNCSDNCSYNRYFSGIKNGCFGAYADGRTSWSSTTGNICFWTHCKLYRPEDVEKYRKKEAEK
jgi:hypothetical protein